jgi:phage-related minor tail protein
LPPRFQEAVWRRIEHGDANKTSTGLNWLEALVNSLLHPKFALATVAALVLLGTMLGVREGAQTAHQQAEARYLAAVAPRPLQ